VAAAGLRVEPLADHHDRRNFECGEALLDRYLHEQAGQDERRNVAACFVLVEPSAPSEVLGYYTLSTHALELTDLPEHVARRRPRYGLVPTVLLGRLAVDRRHQGRGLGTFLLYDALGRALELRRRAGVWAVVVDALDERAATFCRGQEFEPLPGDPLRLYLPLRRVAQLVGT
jgi:GNAT superfamily N-acetyltransferase